MGFSRKYEREIMESEDGQRLYAYWYQKVNKNTDCQEFMTFTGFYKWAMESGYTFEARLYRRDPNGPFNPDNCVWISGEKCARYYDSEFEMRWNKTVNRIRRYYGLEPFRTKAETCSTEVEDCG